eukprot:TRINITY_DN210_c0_g1_i1.p1 TRINITY_DN210_c0_g1~~TRINITY_DN210_c0_g1_i1.p1  ORF type:complete len:211 (+),score=45.53 TRINITY_DN210_c0_g1_i1:36-635(+)
MEERGAKLKANKAYLEETSGWALIKEDGGVKLESKGVGGNPIDCYRCQATLIKGRKAKDCVEEIFSWDKEGWKTLVEDSQEFRVVESGENENIFYQRVSLPWPIWHRDTVIRCTKFLEEGKGYLLFESVEHDKEPEQPSKYVRAQLLIGMMAFEDVEGGVKMTRLVQVDPKGSIPLWVISAGATKVHAGLIRLKAKWEK